MSDDDADELTDDELTDDGEPPVDDEGSFWDAVADLNVRYA